jgi:hypothetical protein
MPDGADCRDKLSILGTERMKGVMGQSGKQDLVLPRPARQFHGLDPCYRPTVDACRRASNAMVGLRVILMRLITVSDDIGGLCDLMNETLHRLLGQQRPRA